MALGFAAHQFELVAQHLSFRARAEVCAGAHRERAGGGRGERGEYYLRSSRDRAAQAREHARSRQDAVLNTEDDFADAAEPLECTAFFFGLELGHAIQNLWSAGPNSAPGSQSAGQRRPVRIARTMRKVSLTLRPTLNGLATQ